jgi:hypothetical protein
LGVLKTLRYPTTPFKIEDSEQSEPGENDFAGLGSPLQMSATAVAMLEATRPEQPTLSVVPGHSRHRWGDIPKETDLMTALGITPGRERARDPFPDIDLGFNPVDAVLAVHPVNSGTVSSYTSQHPQTVEFEEQEPLE